MGQGNALTPHFSSSVLFCKFIQSIPDNQLVRQKLNCMTKIVESSLFQQAGESPSEPAVFGEEVRCFSVEHAVPRRLAMMLH